MRTPPPQASPSFWPWRQFPIHIVFLTLLAYFLRFGYDYSNSDQDELLSFLIHRLSPTLFSQDWFVQTQATGFSVRLYVTMLLEGLSLIFPIWLAVLFLYLVSWIGIATAVFQLGYMLTRKTTVASSALFVLLVLTPQWTLGGNDLVHSMFVPSMLGWSLGLWGVCYFLQKRWIVAGVLLGIASWMQALVGLQLALLLGIISCLNFLHPTVHKQSAIRQLFTFSATFLIASLPTIAPILVQQFTSPIALPDASPPLAYIFAAFRAPHHFLPFSYSAHAAVRFGILAVIGVGAFLFLNRRHQLPYPDFILRTIGIVTALGVFALVFTEAVPVFFVIKLQLFKLTVFLKLLFVVLLLAACVEVLPNVWQSTLVTWLRPNRLWVMLACLAWLLACSGIYNEIPFIESKARPLVHASTPLAEVEKWAQQNTSRDAVFAVPPSFSGFRSRALRGIVINFKAYPFQDEHMRAWFDRLISMAPIAPPERGGAKLIPLLDEAYESQTSSDLIQLAEQYAFTYVVRRSLLPDTTNFTLAFKASPWRIYTLRQPMPE